MSPDAFAAERAPQRNPQTAATLEVLNLRVSVNTPDGRFEILSEINLHVAAGEAVGIVGESGSGKSTTARAIMGILPVPPLRVDSGRILFEGRDLLTLNRRAYDQLRGRHLTMVFQDPTAALNPVFTIGDQMQALSLWQGHTGIPLGASRQKRAAARERAAELLIRVRLPDPLRVMQSYPFQLSGGMRQRVLIAMALLHEPKLVVADEPGTALDVTIQDQILELFESELVGSGRSLLFITHNLGVARRVTQRVIVMYAGEIVEVAPTRAMFESPLHPYTQGLISSVPKLSGGMARGIAGRLPDLGNPPTGCRFHPRCPFRMDVCTRVVPTLIEVEPGHSVACHLYGPAPVTMDAS